MYRYYLHVWGNPKQGRKYSRVELTKSNVIELLHFDSDKMDEFERNEKTIDITNDVAVSVTYYID